MRNRIATALLPLLAVLSACSDENATASAQAAATTVPVRLVDADPIIQVRINGSPIDVHFDIGRGTTIAVFSPQLESITKRRVGTESSGMSMTGPTGNRPIYEVDLVEVGGAKFSNATIVEDFHDDDFQDSFSSRLEAFGFAGRGLFERYKVIIDYQGQQLVLIPPVSPPDQQALCTGKELPLLQGQNWGLASKVGTDIGEMVLVWDTGAPESLVLKRRTDRSGNDYKDGEVLSTERFVIGSHDIGPKELAVWDWVENAPPFDGFIGNDFFAESVVCVDFPNQKIFVRQ